MQFFDNAAVKNSIDACMACHAKCRFKSHGTYVAVILESRYLEETMKMLLLQASRFLSSDWTVMIMCDESVEELYKQLERKLNLNVQVRALPLRFALSDVVTYTKILLDPDFWAMFLTFEKMLIFQTDTMIYKRGIEHFFKYDYVGAPWPVALGTLSLVGNGGFSLRTPRTCYESLLRKSEVSIGHYDQHDDNLVKLKGLHPEDIFFSYAFSQFSYTLPSTKEAMHFSIESVSFNENCIGSHQLDKFHPVLSRKLLLDSVIPYSVLPKVHSDDILDSPPISKPWLSELQVVFDAQINSEATLMLTFMEEEYCDLPPGKSWVGISHWTPRSLLECNTTEYDQLTVEIKECNTLYNCRSCLKALFESNDFIGKLDLCKGIFAFSWHAATTLRRLLSDVQMEHVPVDIIRIAPSVFNTSHCHLQQQYSSRNQYTEFHDVMVVSLGHEMQYNTTIYNIVAPRGMKKLWLPNCLDEHSALELLHCECHMSGTVLTQDEMRSVEIVPLFKWDDCDALLQNHDCRVVIDILDASANEALLKCLSLKIPCFVRRHPAAEEYLAGKDYPLFFENVSELQSMIFDDMAITKAREYLCTNGSASGDDKQQLRNTLLAQIMRSDITTQHFDLHVPDATHED